jgi:hypothetical protein
VARGVSNELDLGGLWPAVGPVCRMNSASRGLRPTVGLRRPGRRLLRRRRPTPGAQRLGRPISIGVKAFGRRSACAPNEFGLPGPSANGRPAPTGRVSFASAEPTPGAQRLGRPISIGVKAFGWRCGEDMGVSQNRRTTARSCPTKRPARQNWYTPENIVRTQAGPFCGIL